MKIILLLVLTFSGLSVPSTNMFREYHHVKSPKTWAEAQRYCREVYADLATVSNQHEAKRLWSAVQDNGRFAWIGLFDDISWKWTLGDADFNANKDYSNWRSDQPDNEYSKESCVVMQHDGLWRDHVCETDRPFICYNEPGPSKYILVNTYMTWSKAKDYCRSNYTDLARVTSVTENDQIHPLLNRNAWLGLYRNLWSNWSDQSPATFTNWNESQPDNGGTSWTSCAAVNTSTGTWWDVHCDEEHEFVCQSLIPPKSKFKLRFRSEADLTDPDIQQQILEQLHAKLKETHGLTDFKLRWIKTDGQAFHKEEKKKK